MSEESTPSQSTVINPTRREVAQALLGTALRLVLGAVLIVAMLNLVPSENGAGLAGPVILGTVGTVVYVIFFRRQIKHVYKARFPTLRAAEALVLSAAMFLAIFSVVYVAISRSDPAAFTEDLTAFSAYYFSLTVLATVGFGDITPTTTIARSVAMVQMAFDLVFIALLIRMVTAAAKNALQIQGRPEPKGLQ